MYIVYNEVKSVIKLSVLSWKNYFLFAKLGSPGMTVAEEMTEEQEEAIARAAKILRCERC